MLTINLAFLRVLIPYEIVNAWAREGGWVFCSIHVLYGIAVTPTL